jgi:hypothetical protein
MEKGKILLGLSLALIGYIFSITGLSQMGLIIVIGIVGLLALLMMLKDILPQKLGKHLDEISNGLDVSWVAFGLGVFGAGINFIKIGTQYISEPLIWLGLVLLLASAMFIGKGIGRSGRRLVDLNARVSIIFGSIVLAVGLTWFIVGWNTENAYTIIWKINNEAQQILVLGIGIAFIWFGWRKWRRVTHLHSQSE